MKKTLLTALALGAALPHLQAAALLPLAATGWNQDIVLGAGETTAGRTATMDGGNAGDTWYGVGFNAGAPATGLPIGVTTSLRTSDLSFQLQGFGTAGATNNNAIYNGGTLTLTVPTQLVRFAVVGSTGNAGNPTPTVVNFTVNYSDATTDSFTTTGQPGPTVANDWFFQNPDTFVPGGRVNVASGNFSQVNDPTNPALYENIFFLDPAKTVNSVTITTPGGGFNAIMAISGEAVPEPSTLGLLALAALGFSAFRRRI